MSFKLNSRISWISICACQDSKEGYLRIKKIDALTQSVEEEGNKAASGWILE